MDKTKNQNVINQVFAPNELSRGAYCSPLALAMMASLRPLIPLYKVQGDRGGYL